MNILIPYRLDGITLSRLVDPILTTPQAKLPDKIYFDFSSLGFIKPTGVAFLGNLVQWLNRRGVGVMFSNAIKETPPLRYLDDSEFFKRFVGQNIFGNSRIRPTTIPFQPVCHSESHAWVRLTLIPWLSNAIGITESSLHGLQVSIQELFNNIKDHTQHDIGSIFVQHYPNNKQVTIAISDFGIGIPANVRKINPNLGDNDSIIQAIEEGFTTQGVPTNRGIGLHYLISTVVCGLRGTVTIYSSSGIVRFYPVSQGTNVGTFAYTGVGFCPGTTISIELNTGAIPVLPDETEELTW